MCFSARIQQDLYTLARRFGASVDWPLFEELFRYRGEDHSIKVARALEANFSNPENDPARRIQAHIAHYRSAQASAWEQELFKQKKRLADAQRSLKEKDTKRAREEERIATSKIENYIDRLADLKRTEARPNDSRIFPLYYAPVVVNDNERLLIRPMRYTCRLAGKPANYDRRYPGTYNAFGAFLTVSS
jgi:hypothetical protein